MPWALCHSRVPRPSAEAGKGPRAGATGVPLGCASGANTSLLGLPGDPALAGAHPTGAHVGWAAGGMVPR